MLNAAETARRQTEADSTTFFRCELKNRLRQSADCVASSFGGQCEDWAFVENATAGLDAVIASLELAAGDELLCLSQVYGAIGNALRYLARRRGARIVTISVPVPFGDAELFLDDLERAVGPKTKLACFDHITSASGVVMPIHDMAAMCRDRGVPILVDRAHAPGQTPWDVPALGVDWYVANLHKWAFAPKGTAVLWCSPEWESKLHPLAISHELDGGFTAEFDYTGTPVGSRSPSRSVIWKNSGQTEYVRTTTH